MELDVEILLYSAVFIGTLLFIEGLYLLFRDARGGADKARNRRLRMIASGADSKTVLHKLRRGIRGPISQVLANTLPSIEKLMGQAGLSMPISRLLIVSVLLLVLSFTLIKLLTPLSLFVCLGIAVVVAAALPYLFLRFKRRSRTKKFAEQLPDSLDLIVRSLRAGHPVSAALDLVSKEMPDPAGSEFGIVVDEMTYGLDIHDALRNLSDRIPHDDLLFVVVSVQIQYMVGGNLAEILGNLSTVIRDRFQMFAKIRAVSAEGRFSGMIVGCLPMVVFVVVHITSPSYFGEAVLDPNFWPVIGFGVLLMLIGHFVIYRMVNFRV